MKLPGLEHIFPFHFGCDSSSNLVMLLLVSLFFDTAITLVLFEKANQLFCGLLKCFGIRFVSISNLFQIISFYLHKQTT